MKPVPKKIAIILLGACALCVAVAAAVVLPSTASINYRVEVTLKADDELVTGNAVWAMTMSHGPTPGGSHFTYRVRGEAIRVPVPGASDIYVLRRAEGGLSNLAYGAFPADCLPRDSNVARTLWALRTFPGPCTADRPAPLLVSFSDPASAATAVRLNYAVVGAADPCPAVCLVSIAVTRTDDPVTTGLEARLPWLKLGSLGSRIGSGEYLRQPDEISSAPGTLLNVDFSTEVQRHGR